MAQITPEIYSLLDINQFLSNPTILSEHFFINLPLNIFPKSEQIKMSYCFLEFINELNKIFDSSYFHIFLSQDFFLNYFKPKL